MEDKKENPFGFESMMNTWSNSMNQMMNTMTQQPFSFSNADAPFTAPFVPPFSDFTNAFQTPGQPSFQWPFPWGGPDAQSSSVADEKKGDADPNQHQNSYEQAMAGMSMAMKNWQILATALSSPSSVSALFKGLGTLPEILSDFAGSSMSGLSEVHQKMMDSIGRMGESVEAYKFDNMDGRMFNIWADLYEKEFRKFLHIPQLGLTREYQEKINDMVDKFNLFQTRLSDFLRLLSLPFQRSAVVMQEEVQKLAEKGELSEDPKIYYQMWIKILEGHFMKLFQTPEYIEGLADTISAMSRFTQAKESVLEDVLRHLPVASRSELDDLAKEFVQLKREIRALKKKSTK